MTSSTARWTTALAAAVCLATPTLGWSQTPPTSQSPTSQQQPTTSQQPTSRSSQQSGEAQEHLRQAQAALKDIPDTIPARAKSRVAELKRHLNALEKSSATASAPASAAGSKTTARGKSNWSTDVAAIDKILTELLGSASASGASAPTGTTGATGATGSKSGSKTSVTLDETTKSKLMEVRTHVTAFAAAMSGTSGGSASAPSPEPGASEPSAAAATQPTTSPAGATAPQSSTPSSYASQSAPGQEPATQAPATAEPAQQPTASPNPQVDPEASKQHLTAARESLSQLTQLPAAAQLSGEARTQVSQLISNFNELITTKENWRASYDKVEANLNALLGSEASAQPAQTAPPTGTGGAVGTTGTASASLDPAIRAKLVEFQSHLSKFEQAAGAPAASSASQGAAATPGASSTTGQSTQPTTGQATEPATGQATQPQQPTEPTTGQSTAGQSTTGTTGSASSTAQQPSSSMGQDGAVRHIEAIEAIINGRSASGSSSGSPSGATTGNAPAGTTGTTTGNLTLTQSQVEEIRMHLAELRKAVNK